MTLTYLQSKLPHSNSSENGPLPILLLVRELDQGGVERDVAKLAQHLDPARFEVHVAAYYPGGLRYQELIAAGIPVLDLPMRKLASGNTVRQALILRNYIRKHRIRLVHSFDTSGIFGLAVAKLVGVPAVIGSQLGYRSKWGRNTRRLMRASDHYSDAILVNCDAMRRHLVQDEHVPERKIELCYNGVVPREFFPGSFPRPKLLQDTSLLIGTVCVLRPEKNLTLLQQAFSRVANLQPGMGLVIVGSGPELGRLQENARRLGIENSTFFVPATRDVAAWMRAMDVFVLPSTSEAFSNSLLEAMACGCAVVGSRVGGTPEMIGNHRQRGLLFDNNSVDQLTDRLRELVVDQELRRELGAKASDYALANLNMEVAASTMGTIYERVLDRRLRPARIPDVSFQPFPGGLGPRNEPAASALAPLHNAPAA